MHKVQTVKYFIKGGPCAGVLHIPAFQMQVSIPHDFNERELLNYLQ